MDLDPEEGLTEDKTDLGLPGRGFSIKGTQTFGKQERKRILSRASRMTGETRAESLLLAECLLLGSQAQVFLTDSPVWTMGIKYQKRGAGGYFFVTCLQHGKCIRKLLAKTRKKNSINHQRVCGEEPCGVHGF